MTLNELIHENIFTKQICILMFDENEEDTIESIMYEKYDEFPTELLNRECDEEYTDCEDCVEIWVR